MSWKVLKSNNIPILDRKVINDNFKELYASKVPYTGATQDIDLGHHGLSGDFIQFKTNATPRTNEEGLLQWNTDDGTLDLGMEGGDITLQIGQESFMRVKNQTGTTLSNGKAIMFAGAVGASGRLLGQYAIADGSLPALYIMGVATHDILNGTDGYVTNFGKVRGINTTGTPYGETWVQGDILYVSPTVAGALTNIKPNAPDLQIEIAAVTVVHATVGSIFVRPSWRERLVDLDDVNGTPLTTDGQMLVWKNTLEVFDFDKNINDYVPYTGASATVNLGSQKLITEEIESVGDLTIDCGTEKTIVLEESVWDDMRVPAEQTKLGALDKPDYDYTNNGLLFPQNDTSEVIYAIVQLPHSYKLSTDIKPHLHYIQTSSDVPVFKLKYRWYKGGDAVPSFTTITSTTNVHTYTSGSIHQKLRFPDISGTGMNSISSILDIQIYREDNVIVGDVLVKEFDIHYQIDTIGSRQLGVK